MRRALTVFSLGLSLHSPAQQTTKAFPWVEASIGIKVLSDVVRRGATLYDAFQITPILYVGLLESRIQFLVTSLEYRDFLIKDLLRGRTKLALVSDRPLFVLGGHPLSIRNTRESSIEWTQTLELFLPSASNYLAGIDVRYAQDLKAHRGAYFEAVGKVTLARWMPENGVPLLQPLAFVSIGWGTDGHNRYQYGPTGTAGFDNVAYGLALIMPSRIESSYWMFQLNRYDVLGAGNRSGTLLGGETGGFHLNFTLAAHLY